MPFPQMKASPEMGRMIRKLPMKDRLWACGAAERAFDEGLKTMARWGCHTDTPGAIEMAMMAAEAELACIVGEA